MLSAPVAGSCAPRLFPIQNEPAACILDEVCRLHKVSCHDVLSESRDAPVVRARDEVAYRLHHEQRLSLTKIGKLLSGRDPSVVSRAVHRHALARAGA